MAKSHSDNNNPCPNDAIYGCKRTQTFDITGNNNALFRDSAEAEGSVDLQKLLWFVPYVHLVLSSLKILHEDIVKKEQIKLETASHDKMCEKFDVPSIANFSCRLGTKTSRPRYIIVAFQTGCENNLTANSSIFDHCNLKSVHVMLNQFQYLAVDYN